MMKRTEKEKMLAGELYNADAPELQAEMAITHKWLARYNSALGASASELLGILLERLAAVGEGAMIRPPFHCDYGFNISLGAGVFLNFNCVILEVVEVIIGEKTQIGPGVQIVTADHPRDAAKRAYGLGFGRRSASGVMCGSGVAQLSCRAFDRISRSSLSWRFSRRSRLSSSRSAVVRPPSPRPALRSDRANQFLIDCAVGANSRASSSGERPARTRSTIWRRNSGG